MLIELEIAHFSSGFVENLPDIQLLLDKTDKNTYYLFLQKLQNNPDLVSDPFCLHKIEGWIVQIFGSVAGFKLFL